MPTSSRWLAVSSELCFRYDSVYARPRRRRDPRDRPRRDRDRDRDRDRPLRRLPRDRRRRSRECDRDCDRDRPLRRLPRDRPAHSSTATATASLLFLSAWYCSAPPPRLMDRHSSSGCWRRQAWLQYRVLHLTHFPSQFWSKGAAQTQQVVRIIVLLKPESL